MPASSVSTAEDRGATAKLSPVPERSWAGSLKILWLTAIPALVAIGVLQFLVPRAGPQGGALLSTLRRIGEYPLVAGPALFLVFSSMARYWWPYLRSGRGAAPGVDAVAAPIAPAARWAEVIGIAATVALAAAAALTLRARVVDSYAVLSASMLPTFAPGDRVAASKLPYRVPERGDVVVFPSTAVALEVAGPPEPFVKRVIGLPGDRVGMTGGIPIINGWKVPTCLAGEYVYVAPDREGSTLRGRLFVEFLDDRTYLTLQAPGAPAFDQTYEVRPGEVFVLGDNRNHSADSRAYGHGSGGGVPLAAVTARVKWFLSGTGLDGRADLRRLFRPIDAPAYGVLSPGTDPRPLAAGIARCLEQRPKETHPPRAQ
jgi:signal peptidase I